ncbi:MAG: GNAT family N-acetyltransferase [Thermoplasmata archaeon]|nr:GNAT family N-acetyltransferase [Thermoplasmata archaeon]
MTTDPPDVELVPLASDVSAALALSRPAITAAFARTGNAPDAEPRIASVSDRIRSGAMTEGRLYRREGKAVGIALWETGHPSGIVVQTLYLAPGEGGTEAYDRFLSLLSAEVAAPVLSPGGLVGLSPDEETALMHRRGFGRYARSEMRFPPGAPLPEVRIPPGIRIRPLGAEDEPTVVQLHRAAFDRQFDQYLFLGDPDPAVDSAREVREMLGGHYGEFLGWASALASLNGRAVGASLAVRAPYGPLLISVMVDPADQGHGVGRALVVANLHALRGRRETVAALNVTEGNERAVLLYEHLGFVRTIGPEHAWYARSAVPVGPGGEGVRTSEPPTSPDTTGSAAPRTQRT